MDASLSEVTRLTEEFLTKKKEVERIEEELIKPLNKEIQDIQGKLIQLFEANDLKKFSSPMGSVNLMTENKVSMPDGDDKIAFVEYLKERGAWDTFATIHHARLNSWYKEQTKENPMFTAPGLGLPTETKYLKRGR